MIEPANHDQAPGSVEERITNAALTLISEHGLGAVTMTEVASTAGVARQTLYSRYPDVDAIVAAALDSHSRTSNTQLQALIATGYRAPAKIDLLVRHIVANAAHGAEIDSLRAALSPEARGTLDEHDQQVRRIIEEVISDGITTGDFDTSVTPADASRIIQGMLEAGARLARQTGDSAAATATTTTMILNALDTTAGRR